MAHDGLSARTPPLVAHVIYRLAVGGLENGLVNLINAMPPERYRHAIVCLTDFSDFRDRIRRPDVQVIALHRQECRGIDIYRRMWRVLRSLRPAIVHTRNLPTLEFGLLAALSGVPKRVHSEHGRDMYDLYGANAKYNTFRRAIRPWVGHYIAVSKDLEQWLESCIGVRKERLSQIYNGVDSRRFHPRCGSCQETELPVSLRDGTVRIGTIGRMQPVKDQMTLTKAFIHLLQEEPEWRQSARLVLVGEGPLRRQCFDLLAQAGLQDLAWIPGERADIAEILRSLDVFVLPSLGEGVSNTILEAMATGLPVLATNVGGNAELVLAGETGTLVPSADSVAMAKAMRMYLENPDLRIRHGQAGRKLVERRFSLEAMVQGYLDVYDRLLNGESWTSSPEGSFSMGEA